jgi:hypothetical protein
MNPQEDQCSTALHAWPNAEVEEVAGATNHLGPEEARMSDRRTIAKLIRFQAEELACITARARACGQTPAAFIRETALGAIPRPRPHTAAEPLLSELARIGRALDQLAHLAQTDLTAGLVEQVRTALGGHEALVRQVVETHRQWRGRKAAP